MAAPINLHPDVALGLALAVIASSKAPLLLLNGRLTVIAASASFCREFQIAPASVAGCKLAALGHGEWDVPQLGSLLEATVAGHADIEAYEMDFCARAGAGHRALVLNAQKLDYGHADIRLLLSVSDVTEARIAEKFKDAILRDKDNLLREKAILHQELQHRVANSLQIIASVLMQSARRVQCEETRTHLYDAHNRVMSVAAMQKQLAMSRDGDVELRSYFTDLCRSIGASMIRDRDQLSLDVHTDDSVTSPDVSMSLGLIVTELVINALKHAFPDHRRGRIDVNYRSAGPGWTLSVGDDGVGIARQGERPKPGLGTSIIEALAGQLEARIVVTDGEPGTMISVVHTGSALPAGRLLHPAL